jgi:hypothetical protein
MTAAHRSREKPSASYRQMPASWVASCAGQPPSGVPFGGWDMILVNARVMAAAWIARGAAVLKTLGPYVALGLLLPGRSLIALLLWLSRHRHRGSGRRLAMRHPMRLMSRDWPRRSATRAPSPLPVMKQSFAYGGRVAGDWFRLFGSDALD